MNSSYAGLFPSLSHDAKVWIYPLETPLNGESHPDILTRLGKFIEQWKSHGRDVIGEATIIGDRFVVISAEIPGGDISGCGIDASVRAMDEILKPYGVSIANPLTVFVRSAEGRIEAMSRAGFRSQSRHGRIDERTVVIDPTIDTLKRLRSGEMEKQARDSWHARLLRPGESVASGAGRS